MCDSKHGCRARRMLHLPQRKRHERNGSGTAFLEQVGVRPPVSPAASCFGMKPIIAKSLSCMTIKRQTNANETGASIQGSHSRIFDDA